jgi:hypothetical protein
MLMKGIEEDGTTTMIAPACRAGEADVLFGYIKEIFWTKTKGEDSKSNRI